jgi:hypothetical protein
MSTSPNRFESAPKSLAVQHGAGLSDGVVKASALALALALGFALGVNGFATHAPEPSMDAPASETQATLKKLADENDALRGGIATLRAQVQVLQAQAAASRATPAPVAEAAKKTVAPVHVEAVSPPAPAIAPVDAAKAATPYYAYVYRYEQNGVWKFGAGAGHFDNVTVARAEALAACQSHGGAGCKFNYATPGQCIAVAQAPKGPLRVSTQQPDDKSAAADALAQCAADRPATPCQVVKTLCSKPE